MTGKNAVSFLQYWTVKAIKLRLNDLPWLLFANHLCCFFIQYGHNWSVMPVTSRFGSAHFRVVLQFKKV